LKQPIKDDHGPLDYETPTRGAEVRSAEARPEKASEDAAEEKAELTVAPRTKENAIETAHMWAALAALILLPLLRRMPPFLALLLAASCVVVVLSLVVRAFLRSPIAYGIVIGSVAVALIWLIRLTYS